MKKFLLGLLLISGTAFAAAPTQSQMTWVGTDTAAACTDGQIMVDSDATPGQQIYVCETTTWTLQGDGTGGGSALATQVDAVEQAADTTIYDFDGTDFTLTESPANDFDITIPDDGHAHTTTSISGLVNADLSGAAGITSANIADATIDADAMGVDSVSASELNATGVEAELEAVLDLNELQGAVTDAQVPDTITASNYLALAGGDTMTGSFITDNLGIEWEDSDTNPTCGAGEYKIYADLSETTFKKCMNGSATDLDTAGGFNDIDTDYGNETVTSTWTFNDVGTGLIGFEDLTIGGADYGGLKIGNGIELYDSARESGVNLDLFDALVIRNSNTLDALNDPGIEFAFLEGVSNTIRLAIPESASGNATAMIRSATIAGPDPIPQTNDIVTCDYWSTYDSNIDCDTGGTGADLFVQDDLEVEGELFLSGTNILHFEADDANSIQLTSANATADRTITLPDETGTVCTTGSVCTGYGDALSTGDTYTGTHNFGGAVLEVPNGAAVTDPAVAGEVAIDTTTDQFLYYGGAQRVITYEKEKCVTIEDPVDADNNIMFYQPRKAITITDVVCRVDGGTSIPLTISDGTNALEAIDCATTATEDDGSITNGTFTALERMEFDLGTPTGTQTLLNFCVTYTIDAD